MASFGAPTSIPGVLSFSSKEVKPVVDVGGAHAPDLSFPILVPRAHDPSGLRQKSRALGATISGMRHRYRLRQTGWAEFGYFLCYFKMVAPRALVFRPLVKGNVDSGNEIGLFLDWTLEANSIAGDFFFCPARCGYWR